MYSYHRYINVYEIHKKEILSGILIRILEYSICAITKISSLFVFYC